MFCIVTIAMTRPAVVPRDGRGMYRRRICALNVPSSIWRTNRPDAQWRWRVRGGESRRQRAGKMSFWEHCRKRRLGWVEERKGLLRTGSKTDNPATHASPMKSAATSRFAIPLDRKPKRCLTNTLEKADVGEEEEGNGRRAYLLPGPAEPFW